MPPRLWTSRSPGADMVPSLANYAEWFTCAARFYFLKEGYAFLSFELAQVEEPGFPVGKLLSSGNRVIGMRFLRPAEAAGDAYEAGDVSRARMAEAGIWLLYALPLSADPLDQQLTHQKVAFTDVADVATDAGGHLVAARTITFRQLVVGLEDGTHGREVPAGETAGMFLSTAREGGATLYLVMNRHERTIIVLGNHRR